MPGSAEGSDSGLPASFEGSVTDVLKTCVEGSESGDGASAAEGPRVGASAAEGPGDGALALPVPVKNSAAPVANLRYSIFVAEAAEAIPTAKTTTRVAKMTY